MRIRPYEATDATLLAELLRKSVLELGPRHYAHEQVCAWASVLPGPERVHELAESRTTLVAVDEEGQPVAYGDLEANGHLDFLYCAPKAAGTGVAGYVYEQLEGHARAIGVARLFTEASEAARGLFLRHGFLTITRRELVVAGVPLHNFAMEKLL
jgi:putative acetyltransferase